MNYKIALLFLLNLFKLFSKQDINYEYLFAHGLAAGKKQLKYYQDIIPKPYNGVAFDCIDALHKPLYPYIIKIPPTAFGQEKDIEVLEKFIKKTDKKIIGIGVSKGAACWINIAANEQIINKIAALVLESPFANVNEVIHKFKFVDYLNYIPFGQYIAQKCAKKILCHYDPYGLQPITSISKIQNKDLPIYLIHSKEDKLIPINHSRRLYKEFLKNGFKNVYLIETELGKHANILTKDPDKLFLKTIHSFYKKFNLPYNEKLIEYDIENYKPKIEEVDKRIKENFNYNQYLPIISKFLIILFLLIYLRSFLF